MRIISVEECQQCMSTQASRVIDIREHWEHTIYSIGIMHIPMAQLVERIKELNASDETVLICKSGKRAEALANLLETEYGFTNVAILEGGITAWAEKFDPTNELY